MAAATERLAKIDRHNRLRVRQVITRRNPHARGFVSSLLERDNQFNVFDAEGDLIASQWRTLGRVERGTKRGADRAHSMIAAAHTYGPPAPAAD